jgi:hypothetical protein
VPAERPGAAAGALVLAAAAVTAPLARRRGARALAAWGAAYLAAGLVAPLAAGASLGTLWLLLGVPVATALLALPYLKGLQRRPR